MLVEVGFVGAAAAFGDEEEGVFVGVFWGGVGEEVDLGGEVGGGVFFLEHFEGGDLGVAEVFFLVGVVDAFGERCGVVGRG